MVSKRGAVQTQPLVILGSVTAWDASVSLCEPEGRHMTLRVSLEEPIKGRSSAAIHVQEQATEEWQCGAPTSFGLGACISHITKQEVHVYATVTCTVMTSLLTVASSNRLCSCLLSCQPPYRGTAAVVTLRLGTDINAL
jgi:hypothetical protein